MLGENTSSWKGSKIRKVSSLRICFFVYYHIYVPHAQWWAEPEAKQDGAMNAVLDLHTSYATIYGLR